MGEGMEDNLKMPEFKSDLPPNLNLDPNMRWLAEQVSIQRQMVEWACNHLPEAYNLAVSHEKKMQLTAERWRHPMTIGAAIISILFVAFCGALAKNRVDSWFPNAVPGKVEKP